MPITGDIVSSKTVMTDNGRLAYKSTLYLCTWAERCIRCSLQIDRDIVRRDWGTAIELAVIVKKRSLSAGEMYRFVGGRWRCRCPCTAIRQQVDGDVQIGTLSSEVFCSLSDYETFSSLMAPSTYSNWSGQGARPWALSSNVEHRKSISRLTYTFANPDLRYFSVVISADNVYSSLPWARFMGPILWWTICWDVTEPFDLFRVSIFKIIISCCIHVDYLGISTLETWGMFNFVPQIIFTKFITRQLVQENSL